MTLFLYHLPEIKGVFMSMFGSAGIRGLVPEEINEKFARKIGSVTSKLVEKYGGESICLATDTRLSNNMLKRAFISGLDTNINVKDFGIVPTPCLALMSKKFRSFGVMITASHNPPDYNGFKFFNPRGIAFYSDEEDEFEKIFESIKIIEAKEKPEIEKINGIEIFTKEIKNMLPKLDMDYKIVLDMANGAATRLSEFYKELGFDVLEMNETPDGSFPGRSPEPTESTLQKTIETVKKNNADFGIAYDGDGDRIALIDKEGFVPLNEFCAFFAWKRCKVLNNKKVSTNIDASKIIDVMVADAGGQLFKTRVGDVSITYEMLRQDGQTAVEQCGHLFSREFLPGPGPTYSLLWLFSNMIKTSEIRETIEKFPKFYLKKGKVEVKNKKESMAKIIAMLKNKYKDATINEIDGIRLDWKDSFMLIRPSGTEHLIRITCESMDEKKANKLLTDGIRLVKNNKV